MSQVSRMWSTSASRKALMRKNQFALDLLDRLPALRAAAVDRSCRQYRSSETQYHPCQASWYRSGQPSAPFLLQSLSAIPEATWSGSVVRMNRS
jgi:hypothetical protein